MSFKRFLNSHFVFGNKNHISFLQGSSFRFAVINCLFLLHNSWVPSAQQLMGICTTAVVRLEILTFPKTDIISSDYFYYYFGQLMLFLSTAHHSTYNNLPKYLQ